MRNLWKKFEELHIFRAGINTMVDINTFKAAYYEEGIDFYDVGRESVFTKDFLDRITANLGERKLRVESKPVTKKSFWNKIFSYF